MITSHPYFIDPVLLIDRVAEIPGKPVNRQLLADINAMLAGYDYIVMRSASIVALSNDDLSAIILLRSYRQQCLSVIGEDQC